MDLDKLTISPADLKRLLPITFVLHHYGHEPASQTYGRLHYVTPWRNDHKPSLDVWFDEEVGTQRAGDFADRFQGDVIDVIGKLIGKPYKESIAEARELYALFRDEAAEGWQEPLPETDASRGLSPDIVESMYELPLVTGREEIVFGLVTERPGIINAKVLVEFDVRKASATKLVLPYPEGRAFRFRYADGAKSFAAGSKTGLYHHPDVDLGDGRTLLIVEGETDTWAAHSQVGDRYHVVGVPGVGSRPDRMCADLRLTDDQAVVVAFDGDEAGRKGAAAWCDYFRALGHPVSVVVMPEGKDVASTPPSEFQRMLSRPRYWIPNTSDLQATKDGYAVVSEKGETVMSNFTLRVKAVVVYDNSTTDAYEVEPVINGGPIGTSVTLRMEDLRSSNSFSRWANTFGGAWWGTRADHQKVPAVLRADAVWAPTVPATTTVGLVGETFVWPEGRVGPSEVQCLPMPNNPYGDPAVFTLHEGAIRPGHTVLKLLNMYNQEATMAMLAWFALAPLRSRLRRFPSLFVTGPAGSGKTTIVQEFLRIMGGVEMSTNLISTTPYGLGVTMDGTNAFPVWFDEYRSGAGWRAKLGLDQLIRDAYDGKSSRRGGVDADNPGRVIALRTVCPLVISGEDFADEQSHRDRIVRIDLNPTHRGEIPLWEDEDDAFARGYLEWLVTQPEAGPAPVSEEIRSRPERFDASSPRQAINMDVLDTGWRLLTRFVHDIDPVKLPKPDWQALLDHISEGAEEPVMDALRTIYERETNNAVWADDDWLYVSSSLAIVEAGKLNLTLPFSSTRALTRHLLNMGGSMVRNTGPYGAKSIRYVRLPNTWIEEV